MQSKEVRSKFLNYFQQHNHELIKSSSLIPHDDPTLLFTNAGMNQFKEIFLGHDKRSYKRAVSVQKCVRAGGKHNDLENVGYTGRHHTFFEMLGNFSFGDYFKLGAIKFAWEFLTTILSIPADRLYVTVYHTDEESYNIWINDIGLQEGRVIKIGDKPFGGSDNFWQMGDIGPCGPCTEIFYDYGSEIQGGLPGSIDEDGDRYVEIWNCVFMQYNKDEDGILHQLLEPSVDTGMGLERITAVMQGVHSNYDTDIFLALIKKAAYLTKCSDRENISLKVLADHIRSISFLISEGVKPGNEGRGYVLRRIMRRAIRHGYKLGKHKPFLYKLVDELIVQMGEIYTELVINKEVIEDIVFKEEEKFLCTIDNGMGLLKNELARIEGSNQQVLSGEVAFKLYDTYGFPFDLTQDICREYNVSVDNDRFNIAMNTQKSRAKASGKFKVDKTFEYDGESTEFLGYDEFNVKANIIALFDENYNSVPALVKGSTGIVVIDKTVFYAEGGGQAGDIGIIESNGGTGGVFNVSDTQNIRKNVVGHFGHVEVGELMIGGIVNATLDLHARQASMRNHSATHLLHKALRNVIGVFAVQKGSYVCSDYTRFDFASDKPLKATEIEEIERIVNHVIMMNYPVKSEKMNYDDAIKDGILALFGEKYGDTVRVIRMGDFSAELCGGVHVNRTGDIGFFNILSETGVSSGVRRIEAITGERSLSKMQENKAILDKLRDECRVQANGIILDKINNLNNENRDFVKQINGLKSELAKYKTNLLLDNVVTLDCGVKLLSVRVDGMDSKILLEMVDNLKLMLADGVIVIGSKSRDRANIIVGVSSSLASRYKANSIIGMIAPIIGGKGGGRVDLAQAGGSKPDKLDKALSEAKMIITTMSLK